LDFTFNEGVNEKLKLNLTWDILMQLCILILIRVNQRCKRRQNFYFIAFLSIWRAVGMNVC